LGLFALTSHPSVTPLLSPAEDHI